MRAACILALLLILLAWSTDAQAVVRRCIGADGSTIYTDKRCEQLDARDAAQATEPPAAGSNEPETPANPPSEPPLSSYGLASHDCARTPEMLLFMVRNALENRDINGLAGLYHWPGMGKWSARAVMDRLETLVIHSDGSANLVFPDAAFVVLDPQAWPNLPPEDPVAISLPMFRVDNPDSIPLSEVELRVIRHTGCWWLHF